VFGEGYLGNTDLNQYLNHDFLDKAVFVVINIKDSCDYTV